MNTDMVLRLVGAVPFFASRGFLALFLIALVARFGFLSGIPALPDAPAWFVADIALFIFGGLALAEFIAEKNTFVRDWLIEFDPEIKGVLGLLTSGALIAGGAAEKYPGVTPDFLKAGFSLAQIVAVAFGAAVWGVARLRKGLLLFLSELDPEDDLRIRRAISWLEDFGSIGGLLLFFIAPLAALIIAGFTILGVTLMQRYLKRREQKSKQLCPACRKPNFVTALACHSCDATVSEPSKLSWLGQPAWEPVSDRVSHQFALLSHRRCPKCAEWLPERALRQSCPACATVAFKNTAAVDAYLEEIERRLPKTLLICGLWSLVPVVGLIPGIVYYRFTLIGGLMLPIMAYTNYRYYRGVLAKESWLSLPRDATVAPPLSPAVQRV